MQTSLKKMMSVPTVDTSYSISIDELDAYPMISVCPTLSPDIEYLDNLQYLDETYFLSGMYLNTYYSPFFKTNQMIKYTHI